MNNSRKRLISYALFLTYFLSTLAQADVNVSDVELFICKPDYMNTYSVTVYIKDIKSYEPTLAVISKHNHTTQFEIKNIESRNINDQIWGDRETNGNQFKIILHSDHERTRGSYFFSTLTLKNQAGMHVTTELMCDRKDIL